MDVKGKVALVTGGASGLGQAVCEELSRHGARVAALDRDGEAAALLVSELEGSLAVSADVTDSEALDEAVAEIAQSLGGLHIVVNCAGVPFPVKVFGRGEPGSLDVFRSVIDVNLVGTFNVMRFAVREMLRSEPDDSGERGVIVNTSSCAAWQGQSGQVAYSASKAGIMGMTLPAARDLASKGIRVMAVAPGLFATPMTSHVSEEALSQLQDMVLEPKRLGRPSEFASLVRHVVENGYLNGTCIDIDAGARVRN